MRGILVPIVLCAGCAIGVAAPRPPAPQPLSRQEAIDVAVRAAEQRGYRGGTIKEVERHDDVWKVDLRVARLLRGSIRVRVDVWTGSVVRFDEHVRAQRRREHDDDDDEDDEHEHLHHRDDD